MTNAISVPAPERVGQGTVIEQSRATAEVLGAIEAAQRWPRDPQRARHDLHVACGTLSVAEHAFFEYRRGTTKVSGATVDLARTMALVWQHVHFGVHELRRDEDHGQSEVLAYAWDVQNAVRSSRIFILPHKRYLGKRGETAERMIDLRDIQENNLSVGGRNVRETIFAVLPPWLREEAERLCHKTLVDGEVDPTTGKRVPFPSLPERVGAVINAFAELKVTERQLIERLDGRRPDRWIPADVVRLSTLGRMIKSGETTVAAEFPATTVSGAEILAQVVGGEKA